MNENLNDFFLFWIKNQIIDKEREEFLNNSSPMINGFEVTLDKAIKKISEVLKKKKTAHLDGLACDQKSINSILSFAEKKRLSVSHTESNEINNFYSAYQMYGASLVSFNELRKRSDLVIIVGNFEKNNLFRLKEKMNWSPRKNQNSIFFFSEKIFSIYKKEFRLKTIFDFLNLYCDCFQGMGFKNKFLDIKNKIEKSNYPVIIFNPDNDFMFTQQLLRISEDLNNNKKKIRLFKLSGHNNSAGYVNSCVSKTGFPGSVRFTDWGVFYNPFQNISFIQKKKIDTQIFFSNLDKTPNIINFKTNIVIGHPSTKNRKNYDVFIPVKTPGIDVDGIVVRSDGAGTMKLKKIIESDYIEIEELMNRIS